MKTFIDWLMETRQGREGKHHKDYNHSKQGMVTGNPRYSGKNKGSHTERPQDFRSKQKYQGENRA